MLDYDQSNDFVSIFDGIESGGSGKFEISKLFLRFLKVTIGNNFNKEKKTVKIRLLHTQNNNLNI